MYTIRTTEVYAKWFGALRDPQGRVRVLARVERLAMGHAGDAKSVGDGVLELRIDVGPGYRVYYKQTESVVILLLVGGDKKSQPRDIRTAIRLARDL